VAKPHDQEPEEYRPRHAAPRPKAQHAAARRRPTKKQVAASAAMGAAGLLALVGITEGAYSTFNSTTSPPSPQNLSTGTVVISLGSGSSGDALTIGATNVAPGDTIQREVVLQNTGTLPLASIDFGVSGDTSNPLNQTSGTSSLQIEVQSCSTNWTASPLADGGYSYTCSGTTSTVLPQEALGTAIADSPSSTQSSSSSNNPSVWTSGLHSLQPNSSPDYLVVTLSLPADAPTSDQGLSDSLTYSFVGVQRNGQPE
jgi:hypothetical protein